MRRLLAPAANRLWNFSVRAQSRLFWRYADDFAARQEQILFEMLRNNDNTVFGRRFGFAKIRSIRDYQQSVPLAEYEDFEPYIARISEGETAVLTTEPVLLLEPTGGSTGGSKLIPYTTGLKRQFQRGIAPWIADLFRHYPELLDGESYWSVSPVSRGRQFPDSAIPVGFDDDSDYVGGLGQLLVRSVQAVPGQVKYLEQMDNFWYVTLLFLLRSSRLSLISVWNPSFLTILCQHLRNWWPQLACDIANGTLSLPESCEPAVVASLCRYHRPDPVRAEAIRTVCSSTDGAVRYQSLWPKLRLISCWRDGAARESVREVSDLFPNVTIQGKGLIATEGFITLPAEGVDGCLPAYCSHFLEFLPEGGTEPVVLHQLEEGATYSVVVTTAGGFYRYRLHDVVRVTGFHKRLPLLQFVGKEEQFSDHFGEKLHEVQVGNALSAVASGYGLHPKFAMLSYEPKPEPGYVYIIEDAGANDARLLRAAEEIDTLLKENFHYRYCRDLGQLTAVRVFRVACDGQRNYVEACCRLGQRLGDVKPVALQHAAGWVEKFTGRMLDLRRNEHD